LISAAQLRQSGPWAARQHYNAAKLLVRIVYAAAQLRAPTRAPQSPPIAISGCKKPLAKSDLVLQNCGLASSCTTVCRDDEPIRKNLDLFMDNRFAQARLLVLLLASMHVYCTCTIRVNFFPLAKDLRKKMIPPTWEGKAINDQNKAAFRQQAANLCSFMSLTMVICFDVGLTRMITSRQRTWICRGSASMKNGVGRSSTLSSA
jgi:hypothetical protein